MPHALSTRLASLASNENDRLTRATSLTARSKKGGFAMGNFVRPLIGLFLSELLVFPPVAPSAQAPASQPKPQTHPRTLADDNMQAKLQLIQQWPAERRRILAQIDDGSYNKRRWGDTKDIGFREITPGQEKDIKAGQDIIKEMKMRGLIPHDLDNKEIQNYVDSVAQRVAQHSDLHIPLHVTVLDSKEINAFALPGGNLFVERGLLEAADDESELAGVIGHEIAHDVARHSHKMMVRATIAGIFFQTAEIAALVLTGGVASIGLAYALEYGFSGLGL